MEDTDRECKFRVIYEHVKPAKHAQAYMQPKPDPIPEEWWEETVRESHTFAECEVWFKELIGLQPADLFRNIRLQATVFKWTTIIPGTKP